jgi:hypothetical protein
VVRTAENVEFDGMPEALRRTWQRTPRCALDPFAQAIITTGSQPHPDLGEVDVMVRADGGAGLPPIDLPACLDVPAERAERLVIVDMIDSHHPFLRRCSRNRRETYEEHRWDRAGEDPEQAAVRRFMASRPTWRRS